jgi:hypothetical protein
MGIGSATIVLPFRSPMKKNLWYVGASSLAKNQLELGSLIIAWLVMMVGHY